MGIVDKWAEKIVNHFWHCCEVAGGDEETLKVIEC